MSLKQTKRIVSALTFGSVVCLFLVMVLQWAEILFAIVLAASAVSILVLNYFFWRCPHCKKRLGKASRTTCEHCGEDLGL